MNFFKHTLRLLLLISSFSLLAQFQDLAELIDGELESFGPIYKENINDDGLKFYKIWGYYAIYMNDVIEKNKIKCEYVLFDKNLNKFANGDFQSVEFKFLGIKSRPQYDVFFDLHENLVLASYYGYLSYYNKIEIEKNTVSKPYLLDLHNNRYYPESEITTDFLRKKYKENAKGIRTLIKENNYSYNKSITAKNYLTFYNANFKKPVLKKISFNTIKDSSLVWSVDLNKTVDKKSKSWKDYIYNYSLEHPEYLFFMTTEDYKKEVKVKDSDLKQLYFYSGLLALNKKTGEQIYNSDVLRPYNIHRKSLERAKLIKDNKLIFLISEKNKKNELNGFRKLIIDIKTGALVSDKTILLKDAQTFLEIKKNNKLKDGFELWPREFKVHSDGSIALIFEKFKERKNYVVLSVRSKTTDLVLFNIDKDFNLTEAQVFDKDVSKGYHGDYLFSQYIDEGKGSVHFFQDLKKDSKTWQLGIVKIKDGKIGFEQIPISEKDEYQISPYPAKNGFILLREFNKNEKYDQIRLEKLNF